MGTERPKDEEISRVSSTAPESKSLSSNVWRMLDAMPGFRERIQRGRQQGEDGETTSMDELRKELDLPGR